MPSWRSRSAGHASLKGILGSKAQSLPFPFSCDHDVSSSVPDALPACWPHHNLRTMKLYGHGLKTLKSWTQINLSFLFISEILSQWWYKTDYKIRYLFFNWTIVGRYIHFLRQFCGKLTLEKFPNYCKKYVEQNQKGRRGISNSKCLLILRQRGCLTVYPRLVLDSGPSPCLLRTGLSGVSHHAQLDL